MREIGASPGRGGYRASLDAARLLFQAREAAARLFSAPDSSRIVFTHSATESLNMALMGTLAAGGHVITTSMEHNSLIRPLHLLQSQGLVTVTFVAAGTDGRVDPDDIRRSVTSRTRMVACSHVSNVSGTIQPITEISAVAREIGALFLLDAAQSAGCIPIDVTSLAVDLLAVPGHKGLFGPQGTGLLYVAPHVVLRPLLTGGTGSDSSSEKQPKTFPDGFESGTHNLPGIAGLKAGIEFVLEQSVTAIGEHERMLVNVAGAELADLDGITLHRASEQCNRSGALSFSASFKDAASLAYKLDQRFDIAVRAGLHCAPYAHRTLGTFPAGTVRMSPGWFTTIEDIALFSRAVVQCLC
jgi:cysteine desulfurase family protein